MFRLGWQVILQLVSLSKVQFGLAVARMYSTKTNSFVNQFRSVNPKPELNGWVQIELAGWVRNCHRLRYVVKV